MDKLKLTGTLPLAFALPGRAFDTKFSVLSNSKAQFYKTFYGRNLRIFLLSWSIYKNRLEKLVMSNILADYGNR